MSDRRHRRGAAGHVLLLFVALVWLPLGTRDAGDVWNVLPALHPLPASAVSDPASDPSVPTAAAEGAADSPDPGRPDVLVRPLPGARRRDPVAPPLVAMVPAVVLLAALGRASIGRRRSWPLIVDHRDHRAPSRAPPVAV